MKIHIITGSTGFVGRYLTEALLKKGEIVWVIIRTLHNTSPSERASKIFKKIRTEYPHSLRIIEGDITLKNLGIKNRIIKELQVNNTVFWHLAANLSFASEDREIIKITNIFGTKNVVDFANTVAKKFVYMSTAYVCGDSATFKESDLFKGQKFRNNYEKTKIIAEKYVRKNCHLPYTIFRPSIIIGDTYQGKAKGCTFGYYRYTFVLYFLKKRILQILQKKNFISFCLRIIGTKYSIHEKILTIPCLVIPYPKNGQVNIITIDYIISSMLNLYEKESSNLTVHLTHPNSPQYHFMFQAALEDIGFKKVKTFPVPAWLFKFIFKSLYFLVPPIRKYMKSAIWYIPYITKNCQFERQSIKKYGKNPPEIDRETLKKINSYAKENILENIKV